MPIGQSHILCMRAIPNNMGCRLPRYQRLSIIEQDPVTVCRGWRDNFIFGQIVYLGAVSLSATIEVHHHFFSKILPLNFGRLRLLSETGLEKTVTATGRSIPWSRYGTRTMQKKMSHFRRFWSKEPRRSKNIFLYETCYLYPRTVNETHPACVCEHSANKKAVVKLH